MVKRKDKLNFTLKVFKNGKVLDRCQTHSIRLFVSRLRTIKWKGGVSKVYLRVSYGEHEGVFGKMSTFINEGDYENKKGLWQSFRAFTEK